MTPYAREMKKQEKCRSDWGHIGPPGGQLRPAILYTPHRVSLVLRISTLSDFAARISGVIIVKVSVQYASDR